MVRGSKQSRSTEHDADNPDAEEVFPINDLPEAIMVEVLHKLPIPQLIKAGYQVCKQWAAAAEVLLSRECAARRWALPRRPRGADSLPRAFPARSLYMRHACMACGQLGEFPVRAGGAYSVHSHSQRQLFLLCKRCTRKDGVQAKLQAKDLYLDAIGVTGKKLIDGNEGRALSRGPRMDVLERVAAGMRGGRRGGRGGAAAPGRGRGRGRGAG